MRTKGIVAILVIMGIVLLILCLRVKRMEVVPSPAPSPEMLEERFPILPKDKLSPGTVEWEKFWKEFEGYFAKTS